MDARREQPRRRSGWCLSGNREEKPLRISGVPFHASRLHCMRNHMSKVLAQHIPSTTIARPCSSRPAQSDDPVHPPGTKIAGLAFAPKAARAPKTCPRQLSQTALFSPAKHPDLKTRLLGRGVNTKHFQHQFYGRVIPLLLGCSTRLSLLARSCPPNSSCGGSTRMPDHSETPPAVVPATISVRKSVRLK